MNAKQSRLHSHPAKGNGAAPRSVALPTADQLSRIFPLILKESGIDLRFYKTPTVKRRIARRAGLLKLPTVDAYISYLRKNPLEIAALCQDALIRVTSFFRDAAVFRALQEKIFPAILSRRASDAPVRIWVPGCCTGEEVYSIAMALVETADARGLVVPIQIFGTDVSEAALEKARAGVYDARAVSRLPKERRERFFTAVDGKVRVNKGLRALCTFARQDITQDPPFSRLDLISCRNVLIYLRSDLQERIFGIFHYALNPNGFLLLGKSETIGTFFPELFVAVDKRHNLYVRKSSQSRPSLQIGASANGARQRAPAPRAVEPTSFDLQREVDLLILNRFAPPAIVVNDGLEVLQVRGDVSPFLKLSSGKASLNVLKMARDGIMVDLKVGIESALRRLRPVVKAGLRVRDGRRVTAVDIEIVPVLRPVLKERCVLVIFRARQAAPVLRAPMPSERRGGDNQELTYLRHELSATKAYLKAVMEEHETVNQELKSANEEILSSNEELQSTNEELETAKEELESTNEELTTVNEELAARNQELKGSIEQLNETRHAHTEAEALAHIGSWRWNMRTNDVYWSEEMYRIYGFAPESIRVTFDRFLECVHPDDREMVRANVETSVRTGKPFAFDHRALRRDGTVRWLHARGQVERDDDGRPSRMIGTGQDITDLRTMRDSLEEAQEHFRLTVEGIQDLGVFLLGPDGRIATWNAGAERIKGYTASEALHRPYTIFFTPEAIAAGHPQFILESAARNGSYSEEGWRRRKDGGLFWAGVTMSALRDRNGQLRGYIKITRDLTLQKQAREALQKSHDELEQRVRERTEELTKTVRSLEQEIAVRQRVEKERKKVSDRLNASASTLERAQRIAHVGSWVWSPDDRIEWSREMWRIFGVEVDNAPLTWERVLGMIHPDDRDAVRSVSEAGRRSGESFSIEHRIVWPDGSVRFAFGQGETLRDEDGSTKVVGTLLDVTQLRENERALRESEKRFRQLADAMPQMVWTAKADGLADYFNERWFEYTGFPRGEVPAPAARSGILHPEDVERTTSRWKDALATGGAFEIEHRLLHQSSGEYRWHLSRALAVRGDDGKVARWFGTSTDIHDQKTAQEVLRASQARLIQQAEDLWRSNNELEQFAYVSSHDLQEPLRKISSYAGLLGSRYQGKIDENADRYIQMISSGVARMHALIQDLLSYSRLNKQEFRLEPVDLQKTMSLVVSDLDPRIQEKGARVTFRNLPTIRANGVQMHQLLQNLVGNAIKFHGDAPPEVEVSVDADDERWIISVKDNGIGIDPKYSEQIFKVFQRLHGREKYAGTGIGLAICKKIAERHGGRIWFESKPGAGAAFFVAIPRHAEPPPSDSLVRQPVGEINS